MIFFQLIKNKEQQKKEEIQTLTQMLRLGTYITSIPP